MTMTLLIAGSIIGAGAIAAPAASDDAALKAYETARAGLKADDLEGRYKLAYDLYEKKQYDLSLRELNDLRRRFPDEERLKSLIKVVDSRRRLRATTERKPGAEKSRDTDKDDDGEKKDPRLGQRQINELKVWQVDLRRRPAIKIDRKTIDLLIDRYGNVDPQLRGDPSRRRFRGAKGYVQLQKMFDMSEEHPGVRALYGDVEMKRDPRAFTFFKKKVHRNYVVNYCASAGCHGENEDVKYYLFRRRPSSDETVYTNFYLLDMYPSAAKYDMIDRGKGKKPLNSLLIQYGRPRSEASTPHPDVPGWEPRLRPRNDPVVRTIVSWIRMLQPVRPRYLIQYRPPVSGKKASDEDADESADEDSDEPAGQE
ncbi:MAG: hypothetical protein CMJ18_23245 [Phycisphaeraceae bacterium]|nr:hypothetical protein [Phycisphaeraceae bacterium]